MLRFPTSRWIVVLPILVAALTPSLLVAQDDPNEPPLGDIARSLRKQAKPSPDVIDDDNLSTVIDQAESHRPQGSALRFLMTGESSGFQVSAPDVTCSLSFTANVKSLLSSQYAQMELPPAQVAKLQGPAAIEGDTLTVSVFNGTDWHVSELAVAFTIVKKAGSRDASLSEGSMLNDPAVGGASSYDVRRMLVASGGDLPQGSEVRPEKKPDVTVIYRMRAAAPPFSSTVFSAPLDRDLGPDEEWHWAIVQARGYPPQNYGESAPQTTAQTAAPASAQPPLPPSLEVPQNASAVSVTQDPQ